MNLQSTVSMCCAQLITFPAAHTVFRRFTHKHMLALTQIGWANKPEVLNEKSISMQTHNMDKHGLRAYM